MSPLEIDSLVAEHCMCLRFSSKDRGWVDANGDLFSWGTDPVLFSTDPAFSKQLRAKMWADGWAWSLERVVADDCIRASFFKAEEEGEFVYADSDIEEMATALAALSAKGHPVEEEQT